MEEGDYSSRRLALKMPPERNVGAKDMEVTHIGRGWRPGVPCRCSSDLYPSPADWVWRPSKIGNRGEGTLVTFAPMPQILSRRRPFDIVPHDPARPAGSFRRSWYTSSEGCRTKSLTRHCSGGHHMAIVARAQRRRSSTSYNSEPAIGSPTKDRHTR